MESRPSGLKKMDPRQAALTSAICLVAMREYPINYSERGIVHAVSCLKYWMSLGGSKREYTVAKIRKEFNRLSSSE